MRYSSAEHWAALREEIVAMAVDHDKEPYGFEAEPTKARFTWDHPSACELGCLALENIPPWEDSLRTRPPVRGSKAYWNNAPDWARAAVLDICGRDDWVENVACRLEGSRWANCGMSRRTGRTYSSDDWQNSRIERPYVWQLPDEKTPADTPEWVRNDLRDQWWEGYHASPGKIWTGGQTRFSSRGVKAPCSQIVLADQNDLGRGPPMDLTLGLET